jgi:hypothetical protein
MCDSSYAKRRSCEAPPRAPIREGRTRVLSNGEFGKVVVVKQSNRPRKLLII